MNMAPGRAVTFFISFCKCIDLAFISIYTTLVFHKMALAMDIRIIKRVLILAIGADSFAFYTLGFNPRCPGSKNINMICYLRINFCSLFYRKSYPEPICRIF